MHSGPWKPLSAAAVMLLFSPLACRVHAVSNSLEAHRDAMRKLSFLIGHWSGLVSIVRDLVKRYIYPVPTRAIHA